MPSRPLYPEKPIFYLDHSTLCHAFRGAVANDPNAKVYVPLFPWIGRVSREANLCLSQAHLQELAQWSNVPLADAMAMWLNGLETVWVPEFARVQEPETEHWVRVAMGQPPADEYRPYVPSMFSAVVVKPEALPGAIEARDLRGMLELFRQVDAGAHTTGTQRMLAQAHADRQAAIAAGMSARRKADEAAYDRERAIRQGSFHAR